MHQHSYEMMARWRSSIPAGSRVLDVGGADVNGSYRPLFEDASEYLSLDFADADVVVDGPSWPMLADDSFDAVISGQAFEHDALFWLTMLEVARVLRPGGLSLLIVPAAGGIHRHPLDCWRFYPDSMRALADWSGLELVKRSEINRESPWRDLLGMFRKPAGWRPLWRVERLNQRTA